MYFLVPESTVRLQTLFWATGPKAASANQKTLLTKGQKKERAGNAQREHKIYPHSALAVFLTALLTRAGERTA
jgi:hypothetical protein